MPTAFRLPVRAGLLLTAVALMASACTAAASAPERTLAFDGPAEGALVNAEQLTELTFTVTADGEDATVADIVVLLDGTDVTDEAQADATSVVYTPGGLDDGDRTVTILSVPPLPEGEEAAAEDADAPEPEELHVWSFSVDATPPEIELTSPEGAVVAGAELTVAGITEPGSTIAVGSEQTTAGSDGAFELVLPQAPDGALQIVATDPAGNSSDDEVRLVTVPSRVESDQIRTVHVSFCGWVTPSLRDPVLQQIEDGLINAVQLDLKDETGKIGFDTQNEFAAKIGSDQPDCRIDLPAAIEQLHGLGVPVIGRIVAFADPVLAPWAFANDERDMAIQTADGDLFTGSYAGFANFANPDVIEYNIAIAEEAAAAGVDHILWDYIRKPDGREENFRFAGLETTPGEAIVEFTRLADERLAPYGVKHGASVYGVSADRPTEVAQDIPALAEYLDYVSPMIYPSHWGPGEYGVADPLRQPGDMVAATLEIWLEVTDGKRASVKPWLEDSNWPVRLGFPDRARYVREQIQATYDAGIDDWLLWDSSVRYTTSAMIQPPQRDTPTSDD